MSEPKCTLKPGEVCLMCGTVGVEKVKSEKKPRVKMHPTPVCWRCTKPFYRGTPWRLVRGRRVHVACWENNVMPA